MINSGTKIAIAATLFLGLLTTASYAHSPEAEQACTPDAMRLCSAEIPDVGRVTACMVQKRAELSAPCAAYFHEPAAPAPMASPVNYRSSGKPGKPVDLAPKSKRG